MSKDYYKTLDVGRDASASEIKKAYRRLAMEFHPDRNSSPEAEDKFKEASEAYNVLFDEDKRRRYDAYGADGLKGSAFDMNNFRGFEDIFGGGLEDLFGSIFSFGQGGGRSQNRPRRGQDLSATLEMAFEEAAFGTEKELKVEKRVVCASCRGSGAEAGGLVTCASCAGSGQVVYRRSFISMAQTCGTCHGRGQTVKMPCNLCEGRGMTLKSETLRVKVPPGVEDGMQLRLSGKGEGGMNGGPNGDLYVFLSVKTHPLFERRSEDLLCTIPVSVSQAVLGTEIEIPLLGGASTSLKIPPGTQSGETFEMKKCGLPRLHGRGTGHLYATVSVKIPTQLDAAEKELYRKLAELEGDEPARSGENEGFFKTIKNLIS